MLFSGILLFLKFLAVFGQMSAQERNGMENKQNTHSYKLHKKRRQKTDEEKLEIIAYYKRCGSRKQLNSI